MHIKPNVTAALAADAYRATHQPPAADAPKPRGHHMVQPGQHLVYWGLDHKLWGQEVTVTGLCPLDYRCGIRLGDGSVLAQVNERGLFGGLR